MKKLLARKLWQVPIAAIIVIIMLIVGGGAALATSFSLDTTIPATVTVLAQYTVTVNAGTGGTATGGGTYDDGDTAHIGASPTAGYVFTGWTGGYVGSENPHDIIVHADMTITANFAQLVTLYTDLNCTVPWSGTMNFGTLHIGQTATQFLYFKANRSHLVPGGYGTGEIDPDSIVITDDDINSAVATSIYVVGEPFGSLINGNHPCMITFSVTAVGPGTTNFGIHVIGHS